MTPAQLILLKDNILSLSGPGGVLEAFVTNGNHQQIADYYNSAANPAVLLWKPAVSGKEINSAVDWAAFVALTVQQQNAFMCLVREGSVDATDAQVRSGFGVIFGGGSATVTALTAIARRAGTRLEVLFAVDGVSPIFGQQLQHLDVAAALRS